MQQNKDYDLKHADPGIKITVQPSAMVTGDFSDNEVCVEGNGACEFGDVMISLACTGRINCKVTSVKGNVLAGGGSAIHIDRAFRHVDVLGPSKVFARVVEGDVYIDEPAAFEGRAKGKVSSFGDFLDDRDSKLLNY